MYINYSYLFVSHYQTDRVDKGFDASVQGYQCSAISLEYGPPMKNQYYKTCMQEFQHYCDSFSKAGENISKIICGIGSHETKEWNDKRFNCEKWFEKQNYFKQK